MAEDDIELMEDKISEDGGSEPHATNIDVFDVEDSEIIDVDIDHAFAATGEANEDLKHSLLTQRDLNDQHPITAITGLRGELDGIHALKTVESDAYGSANYYLWEDENPYKLLRDGYFVSIHTKNQRVRICNDEEEIFGVTVSNAGFIGSQNEIKRDNSYALVSHNGMVSVRCELDVNTGDYVICNKYGQAKKSDNEYGFKVIGLSNIEGDLYAVISLDASMNQMNKLGKKTLEMNEIIESANANATAAINAANEALEKSEQAVCTGDGISKDVADMSDKINSFSGYGEQISQSLQESAEARGYAEQAVSEAIELSKQIKQESDEAWEQVKKDLSEANALKANAQNIANAALEETLNTRKNLQSDIDDMTQSITDVRTETQNVLSEVDDKVKSAIEDAQPEILEALLNDETLNATIKDIAGGSADVRDITARLSKNYKIIDETWNNNNKESDIIYYNKKDELYYYYSIDDGWHSTTDAYTAGLITSIAMIGRSVDENSATINDLVKNDGTIASITKRVSDAESSITSLTSAVAKGGVIITEDIPIESDRSRNSIYYNPTTRRYYYWDEKSQQWLDTTSETDAGVSSNIAYIEQKVDALHSEVQSVANTAEGGIADVKQIADDNTAAIMSVVGSFSKYNVGLKSPAYNLSADLLKLIPNDTVYVSSDWNSHSETYANGKVCSLNKFDRYFLWKNDNWVKTGNVLLPSENPDNYLKSDYRFWYSGNESTCKYTNYITKTLYERQTLETGEDPQWVAVATVDEDKGFTLAGIQQTADEHESKISSLTTWQNNATSTISGIQQISNANKASIDLLTSYTNEDIEILTEPWDTVSNKSIDKIYYDKDAKTYYYNENGVWKASTNVQDVGIIDVLASIKTASSDTQSVSEIFNAYIGKNYRDAILYGASYTDDQNDFNNSLSKYDVGTIFIWEDGTCKQIAKVNNEIVANDYSINGSESGVILRSTTADKDASYLDSYIVNPINLLNCDIEDQTIDGISFKNNKDGTISVSGIADREISLDLGTNLPLVVGKTYQFSGCPSNNYYIRLVLKKVKRATTTYVNSSTSGTISVTGEDYIDYSCSFIVGSGQTIPDNFKITPSLLDPEYLSDTTKVYYIKNKNAYYIWDESNEIWRPQKNSYRYFVYQDGTWIEDATVVNRIMERISSIADIKQQADILGAKLDIVETYEDENSSALADIAVKVSSYDSSITDLTTWTDKTKLTKLDSWNASVANPNEIYYVVSSDSDGNDINTYYYSNNGIWVSTTDITQTGVPSSIAYTIQETSKNGAQIKSFLTTNDDLAKTNNELLRTSKSTQSVITSINKYAVGKVSQANGLTMFQANDILSENMVYVPTENHVEEYWGLRCELLSGFEDFKNRRDNLKDLDITKIYFYPRQESATGMWYVSYLNDTNGWVGEASPNNQSSHYYSQSFSKNNYYIWQYNETYECNTWTEQSDAVIFSQPTLTDANDSNLPKGSSSTQYWYSGNTTCGDDSYKKDTLYKWDNKKNFWVEVWNEEEFALNRAVSKINQTANDVKISVTDATNKVAAIDTKVNNTSSTVTLLSSKFDKNYTKVYSFDTTAVTYLESNNSSAKNAITGNIYYASSDKTYYYYDTKWKSSTKPSDAGLVASLSSIQTQVDDIGSKVILTVDDGVATPGYITGEAVGDDTSWTIGANHINFEADDFTIDASHINFSGSIGANDIVYINKSYLQVTSPSSMQDTILQQGIIMQMLKDYCVTRYGVCLKNKSTEDFVLRFDQTIIDYNAPTNSPLSPGGYEFWSSSSSSPKMFLSIGYEEWSNGMVSSDYRYIWSCDGGLVISANGGGNAIVFEASQVFLPFGSGGGNAPLYVGTSGKISLSSSSIRYKENVTDEFDAFLNPTLLYNLPVKQYNYKKEYKDKELVCGTQIGIIAEDVEKYYPNAVIYNKDGQVESWQDRIMIPAMLKLIQLQKQEIDSLEKRIEKLES